MKKIFMTVFIGGLGFWIGANRLLPLWLIVVMAVLGVACWGASEWMERREDHHDES